MDPPGRVRRPAAVVAIAGAALLAACAAGSAGSAGPPPPCVVDAPSVDSLAALDLDELIRSDGMAPPPRVATTAPRLTNGDVLTRAVVREYPAHLREARIGGVVKIWVLVGDDGLPITSRLGESSRQPELDAAALRLGPITRFSPATRDGCAVPVWVAFPVTFRVAGS